jgi:transporter family-2 protein
MPSTHAKPRSNKFLHIFITFIASIVITGQSTLNSKLNTYIENPLLTAVINFVTGIIVIILVMIVKPKLWRAFRTIPSLLKQKQLRWWHLLGGLSGAFFVATQSSLVAVLGVAIFTVAVVAGQTSGALITDKFGIGPAGKQPITLIRIAAAILGIVGVVVSVSGDKANGTIAIGSVLLCLTAGFLVSTQPALNGQIALRTGHPIPATMVNFIVGLIAISIAFFGTEYFNPQGFNIPPMPWVNPLIWLGGPAGVFFVLTAAFMARTLGVFLFTLTSVVGQLSGAIILDLLLPTAETNITFQLIVGIVITGLAVVLAGVQPKSKRTQLPAQS